MRVTILAGLVYQRKCCGCSRTFHIVETRYFYFFFFFSTLIKLEILVGFLVWYFTLALSAMKNIHN